MNHNIHFCLPNFSGNETKEWDIRLVGGKYLWEGRVEIFLHGVWGTFCDDGAYTNDASVVCRQLGYTIYSKSIHPESIIKKNIQRRI